MTNNESQPIFASDKPLTSPDQDKLGYTNFAKRLAAGIVKMTPTDGMVIALNGEWGSGKSSIIGLIKHYIETEHTNDNPPIIVNFNPWWFSNSSTDLMTNFLDQLFAKLGNERVFGKKFRSIFGFARQITEKISVIPGAEIVSTGAKILEDFGKTDIYELKDQLVDKLKSAEKKILIVIDDIDRLSKDEMIQIFTVIKAIADFPYVTYLLAFDRKVVAETIGKMGEAYLDKIIQTSFDIPAPTQEQSALMLYSALDDIVDGIDPYLFLPKHRIYGGLDLLSEFINTPRKVVRFINALRLTYAAVEGEIHVNDFIILEAIRLYFPEAYQLIQRHHHYLTADVHRVRDDKFKEFSESNALFKAFSDEPANHLVAKLLSSLFPVLQGNSQLFATQQHYRAIANKNAFYIYFQLSLKANQISFWEVENLINTASKDNIDSLVRAYVLADDEIIIDLCNAIDSLKSKMDRNTIINVINGFYTNADLFLKSDSSYSFKYVTRLIENLLEKFDLLEDRYDLLIRLINKHKISYISCNVLDSAIGLYSRLESAQGINPEALPECLIPRKNLAEAKDLLLNSIQGLVKRGSFTDYIFHDVFQIWYRHDRENAIQWYKNRLSLTSDLLLELESSQRNRRLSHDFPTETEPILEMGFLETIFSIQELQEVIQEAIEDKKTTEEQRERLKFFHRLITTSKLKRNSID